MSTEIVFRTYEKLKECLPVRSSFQQRLAVNVYGELSRGNPISISTLASQLNISENEIKSKIEELPGIYRNDDGDIIGFWGLAVGYNSPHKLLVDGISTNTWCAWDALFIPEVLGKVAEVQLTCPVTDHVTSLKASASGLTEVSNENAVISFVMPDVFDADVIKNFCHFIYGFKNKEAFEQWKKDGHENCFAFSLQEAFELGKLKNKYQFGEVLEEVQ